MALSSHAPSECKVEVVINVGRTLVFQRLAVVHLLRSGKARLIQTSMMISRSISYL